MIRSIPAMVLASAVARHVPPELNIHNFGRIAIARCQVKMRCPSGPDSVQVSPTSRGSFSGAVPTCALPG